MSSTDDRNSNLPVSFNSNLTMTVDQARTVAEVQAAIVVAQGCPRNEEQAYHKVMVSCKRRSLAEQSMYAYPRGGQTVSGPSIRLAEVIARHWGNIQYGVREIEATDEKTRYEAFCWDVQSNTRVSLSFTQKHVRWSKKKGLTKLTDPRDQYEIVANNAARRLRRCILQVVPAELVDSAVEACHITLKSGSKDPLEDRVKKMVHAFAEIGVTEGMITDRLKHNLKAVTELEVIQLIKIFKSLTDGMSAAQDWFEPEQVDEKSSLNQMFEEGKEQKEIKDVSGKKQATTKSSTKKDK